MTSAHVLSHEWFWRDINATWQRYELASSGITSDTIEQQFLNDPKQRIQFNLNACSYVIDLQQLIQTNTTTGKQRQLARSRKLPNLPAQNSITTWFWESDKGSWLHFDAPTSNTLDRHYGSNSTGMVQLNYNGNSYEVDFANMTQRNTHSGRQRRLQRRTGYSWFWQADNGMWTSFDFNVSSLSSSDIDQNFTADPNRKLSFTLRRCQYELDFINMIQTNLNSGKQRKLTRSQTAPAAPITSASGTASGTCTWYFLKDDNTWQSAGSVSSQAIESQYQISPTSSVSFSVHGHPYVIDFVKMIQTNTTTGKQRRVSRVSQPTTTTCWYCKDNNDQWQPYDGPGSIITSDAIEQQYAQNTSGSFQFTHGSYTYIIDFSQMLQINQMTNKQRQIQRCQPTTSSATGTSPSKSAKTSTVIHFPPTWDYSRKPASGCNFLLVPVTASGPTVNDYNHVVQQFNKTMPGVAVKSVSRIQNTILYESYVISKRVIQKRLGKGNGVRRLFHGTKKQYIDTICHQGFDWRLYGTAVGARYGNGTYFARDASYSESFTDCRTLFLVRVLVGEYAAGTQGMLRPPAKHPSNPNSDLYDTCVDDINNPSIFVTFERAHSYPEYLIEY